jgi:hypothetical protein
MSKAQKIQQNSNRPAPTGVARWILPLAAVLLVGVAGVGYWWTQRPPAADSSAVAPVATVQAANQSAPAAAPGFAKLKGRWLRPDGGYILEIRSVAADGKMDATYNNPNPIHVARAEASQAGATLKVFVELRDVHYPGSTYNLTYAAESDQLTGIYYQAALQQQFEVVFVRAP